MRYLGCKQNKKGGNAASITAIRLLVLTRQGHFDDLRDWRDYTMGMGLLEAGRIVR